jgi:hypothetical protein
MGKVVDTLNWATSSALVRSYCHVDGTDHDTVLETMFDAACQRADEYLNNPFEEIVSRITVASPVAGDTVSIITSDEGAAHWVDTGTGVSLATVGAASYTAAAAQDEDDREFGIGATDTDTAANIVSLINSTTVQGYLGVIGLRDVIASSTGAAVTIRRRYPYSASVSCASSSVDRLAVRAVRTDLDLPESVTQWVMQSVYRNYRNRGAMMQESVGGQGVAMWASMKTEEAGMTESVNLLAPYRREPGF